MHRLARASPVHCSGSTTSPSTVRHTSGQASPIENDRRVRSVATDPRRQDAQGSAQVAKINSLLTRAHAPELMMGHGCDVETAAGVTEDTLTARMVCQLEKGTKATQQRHNRCRGVPHQRRTQA